MGYRRIVGESKGLGLIVSDHRAYLAAADRSRTDRHTERHDVVANDRPIVCHTDERGGTVRDDDNRGSSQLEARAERHSKRRFAFVAYTFYCRG